jgi:methanethiol S-methyltransferase
MQSSIVDITVYGIFWFIFSLLHSFMASDTFKEPWLRILGPLAAFERLFYNGASALAIGAVLSFARYNLAYDPIFQPVGIFRWLFLLIQGGGVALLLWSFTAYDPWRFVGLRQLWAGLQKHRIGEEPMVCSIPHQFVRHPMYSGVLLLLWFQPLNEGVLLTNIFATTYLLVGLRLEEGRLSSLYGEEYERYQQAVPALIPHPNRRWQPDVDSALDQ